MKISRWTIVCVAMISLLLVSSCSQPSGLSNSQAQAIAAAVMSAFGTNGQPKSLSNGTPIALPKTIGYTISTSGTANSGSTTITFTGGYSYDGVAFNSGSVVLAYTTDLSTYLNMAYTGTMNITYQGSSYEFSWNITMNWNMLSNSFGYTGNFNINGQTFTYTG
jgi:hypothetical protein